MKSFLPLMFLLTGLFLSGCRDAGCTDKKALNYDETADKPCGCCKYNFELVAWFDKQTSDWLLSQNVPSFTIQLQDWSMVLSSSKYSDAAPDCGTIPTIVFQSYGRETMECKYSVRNAYDQSLISGVVTLKLGECTKLKLVP